MSTNFVYLITDGEFYKIGVSSGDLSCKTRLSQLQTANARKLSVIGVCLNIRAYEIELYLHRQFDDKRLIGEWFNLSSNDVESISFCFSGDAVDVLMEIDEIKENEMLETKEALIKEKPNRSRLIQIMTDYRVSIKDVTLLIGKADITIRTFRSIGGTDITGNDLELLEFKLAAKYDR